MRSESIIFYGHPNVQSFHARTIEITKDRNLSLRGDCIIGVCADKGCFDLDPDFKSKLRDPQTFIVIELIVGACYFKLHGRGDNRLTLTNQHDIVLRKSNFICNRTLAVSCNSAASHIPRNIIELLKDPSQKGEMIINVE